MSNKCCLNCKYWWNGRCHNNNFSIEVEDFTYDNIIDYVEEGILSKQLKEKENLNTLANNTFIPVLEKYFKKSCIDKALNEEYEEHEEEIYEYLEDIFSDMLMTYFKKFNTELKQTIEIKEPENFYCCKWE